MADQQSQASAREVESLLLRRIAQRHQNVIAAAMGLTDSQVSRIVANEAGVKLEHFGSFLGALGLRLVADDGGMVLVDADRLRALTVLAREALTNEGPAHG